jgi:hypothetical protein
MRGAHSLGFAALTVAACTFPGVTYAPADGGVDAGDAATGMDVTPGEDAPPEASGDDATEPPDGSSEAGSSEASMPDVEASVPDVLEATVVETGPDAPPCDQDQDGYLAKGSCGGNDCDDLDRNTNPGVTAFQTAMPPSTQPIAGDWNCDGRVQKQYPTNLACSGNGVLGCTGGNGFILDPGCGGAGPFGTCESSGGLAPCMPVSTSNEAQGCL